MTAGLATASWLPTALKALTPTPDPGQLVPPSEAGLDCWLAKAGGPLLLGTPRAGIPGVGITLSNPPLESWRGREAVDMGGGRRGLRQNFSYFLGGLCSPGQEPLLAGDQRHPDLGRLFSETRVEGAAEQCAVQRSGVMAARCSVFTLPRREGRELTTGERKRNSSQQQQKRRRRSKGAGGREKGGGYRHFHHLMMTVMVVHLGDATRK